MWRQPPLSLSGSFAVVDIEVVLTLRIAREPAFAHSLALLEHFLYAPEARESHHAGKDREHRIAYIQRHSAHGNASKQKSPPAAHSEIIFALDDKGMKNTDDKKCGKANEQALENATASINSAIMLQRYELQER